MKLLRKKNTLKIGRVYHRQHAKNGTYFYVNTITGREIWHTNDISKPIKQQIKNFKENLTDFFIEKFKNETVITILVFSITIYLLIMLFLAIYNTK